MKFFIKRYASSKTQENPLWLVVLSDIMTNLMLFFLILYVFTLNPEVQAGFVEGLSQEVDVMEEKEKKAEEVVQKILETEIAEELARELEKSGLKDLAEVQVTDTKIRINIAAPILFPSGGALLSGGARETLDAVGRLLSELKKNDVVIEGHTDNVQIKSGEYSTNWELSAARASAVLDYIAAKRYLPEERMVAAAYGEHRPVADNSTREGRALNRRIEIVVKRE